MTNTAGTKLTTKTKRWIAIGIGVLVAVPLLALGGFAIWIHQVTYASDTDCATAQAVVTAGGGLTDAAAEKSWAANAQVQKDKISHERLRSGVTKYIDIVDRTFSGSQQPNPEEKGHAFSDMWDACRDIKASYPAPR